MKKKLSRSKRSSLAVLCNVSGARRVNDGFEAKTLKTKKGKAKKPKNDGRNWRRKDWKRNWGKPKKNRKSKAPIIKSSYKEQERILNETFRLGELQDYADQHPGKTKTVYRKRFLSSSMSNPSVL